VTVDGVTGDRLGVAFEVAMAAGPAEGGFGDDHPHGWSVGAEQRPGVNIDG